MPPVSDAPAGGARVSTRPAPPAAETLLRAALDLFARLDYSTVTIKDIAQQTGCNPSLIYYYFDNKEELFLRAIEMTVADAFGKFEALSTKDGSADRGSPDEVISVLDRNPHHPVRADAEAGQGQPGLRQHPQPNRRAG